MFCCVHGARSKADESAYHGATFLYHPGKGEVVGMEHRSVAVCGEGLTTEGPEATLGVTALRLHLEAVA